MHTHGCTSPLLLCANKPCYHDTGVPTKRAKTCAPACARPFRAGRLDAALAPGTDGVAPARLLPQVAAAAAAGAAEAAGARPGLRKRHICVRQRQGIGATDGETEEQRGQRREETGRQRDRKTEGRRRADGGDRAEGHRARWGFPSEGGAPAPWPAPAVALALSWLTRAWLKLLLLLLLLFMSCSCMLLN